MIARRLLLLLSLCLVSLAASAAFVEDRSPFRQGHWWNPARSGHGFEVLNAGQNVFVVWYTYDTSSRPIWYTAQGTVSTLGTSWALQKHRWSGNRIAESTTVGSLNLKVNHFESLTAAWSLDGAQGSWNIEPFVQSGVINEVDLSGHWYDPANSGWGMTLVDQGDVFGAVIYAYDPSGAPTWVAGFDRGKGARIALYSTRSGCPSCFPSPVGTEPAGSIEIAHRGDGEITVSDVPSIPLAAGLRIAGAEARQLGRPASMRRADYQLVPFRTDQALKSFIVAGLENRTFGSAGADFSPAPSGAGGAVSFSTTNTQVEGVDEADVVKTDGARLYSVTPLTWTGNVPQRKIRIAGIDGGTTLRPAGEIPLGVTGGNSVSYAESSLYLHAGNLVALSTGYFYGGWWYTPMSTAETQVEIHSVAQAGAPVLRYRATLPGTMVSSRRIQDKLYLVTRFTPNIPGYINYAYTDAQRMANRGLAEAQPLMSLLPWIAENGGEKKMPLGLSSIYAPQQGASRAVADMVVVSVFDVRQPQLLQTMAILGRTEAMYVSNGAIYLASSRYETRPIAGLVMPEQKSLLNTDIHKIAIDGDMRLVGSGSVEGWVNGGWWGNVDKAAFRFGEMSGRLGVVTSMTLGWWGDNSNRVTVLEPSSIAPGLLKTVSWLPNARRPETLGKPMEALYGTRFVGDKLYAVTFRRTDPLYTVDLSNASDPRITGALEVPGFSDYLHPMPNGLLLGFGRDASETGVLAGLAVSLFDVNGATPRELQRLTIGKAGSDSTIFSSHHALSVLPRQDGSVAFAMPAVVYDTVTSGTWLGTRYVYSGLLRFEMRGATAGDARLSHVQTLKTHSALTINDYPSNHAETSWGYGRSVLFPDASIYAGQYLWRQDAAGNVQGPY